MVGTTAPLPFGTRDSEGEAHSAPDVGHGENTHQCGPTEAVGKLTRRRKEPKEAYWIAASVARFLPIIRTSLPINPAYLIAIPSRLNSLGW